jgi:predicted outer membrane repeat protein
MSGFNRMRRSVASTVAMSAVAAGLVVAAPLATPTASALTTFVVNDPSLDYEAFSLTSCAAALSCSLQDALQGAAQLLAGPETDVVIEFAANVQGQVFQPAAGPGTANPAHYYVSVPAGETITIRGSSVLSEQPIFDGQRFNRLFDFGGPGTVVMENLRLRNGGADGNFASPAVPQGGAINTTAQLVLDGVTISGSEVAAPGNGGAIAATRNVTIRNSTISNNRGVSRGGGIYIGTGASLTVENSTFSGNVNGIGGGEGGAVYCDNCASVTVGSNSVFSGNNGRNGGGAIALTGGGFIDVADSTFSNNEAFNGDGGAIGVNSGNGGSVAVRRSTFTTNRVTPGTGGGGAIACSGGGCGAVTVRESTLTGNTSFEGGAIRVGDNATLVVTDSTFANNVSTQSGGAIYCDCTANLDFNVFNDNQSDGFGGGGAIYGGGSSLTVSRSLFDRNRSANRGAVVGAAGRLDISLSVFRDNVGALDGSAVGCVSFCDLNLRASTMSGNTATGRGAGLWFDDPLAALVATVTVSGNSATGGGSAIAVNTTSAGSVIDVVGSTLAGNTGSAISLDGAATGPFILRESIVADNAASCVLTGLYATAFIMDSGATPSVVEGGGCPLNGTVLTGDPGLRPLADLGGFRVLPNSTAIPVMGFDGTSIASNLTGCTGPSSDGRGFPRDGVACDAGAFELDLNVASVNAANRQVDSPAAIVSIDAVPNAALTPPIGNGSVDSQALTAAQVRGIDLDTTPLRNIPLRNIGLNSIDLSRELLGSISLSQIPLEYPGGGGWPAYLTAVNLTQLAAQPLNTITLLQLLEATATLPASQQLDLGQLDLSATPLGSLSVGALGLAGAPVASLVANPPIDWCAIVAQYSSTPCGPGRAIDPATASLVSLSLEGVPLRNIPLRNIPLRNIDLNSAPLRNIPLRNIPLRNIDLSVSPLRNIPLRNIPLRNIPVRDSAGNVYDLGTVVAAPLRNIPLRNIDLSVSPLRNIPLRNIPLRNITVGGTTIEASPLRNIPLRNIPLRNIDLNASPLRNIPLRNIPLRNITVGGTTIEASPLRNIPLRNIPLRNIPLRNIGGLQASPLRNIPLRNIDLSVSPLRNIPLRNIATIAQLVDCQAVDCTSATITLGQATLLQGATLGLLADGLPDATDLGVLGDIVFGPTDTFVLADIADAFQQGSPSDFTLAALLEVFAADLDNTYTLGDLASAIAAGAVADQSIFDLLYDSFTISDLLNILLASPGQFGIAQNAATGVANGIGNLTIDQLIELLAELEPPVTLADLFLGVLDPDEFSWEELDLSAAADGLRSAGGVGPVGVPFDIAVDSTLPSGWLMDLEVTFPEGFTFVPGSLGLPLGATAQAPPTVSPLAGGGSLVVARIAMPEGSAQPTPQTFPIRVRALAPLEVGTTAPVTATVKAVQWGVATSTVDGYQIGDALEGNDLPGEATILPDVADRLVVSYVRNATDVDWLRFQVTQGQELSLILSNLPADYDMLLFGPSSTTSLRGAPIRTLVPAADNGLSLLGGDVAVAQIGPDVDTTPPAGFRLVEGSARRGADDEKIDTGPLAAGTYYVKISGYNGANSPRPYVLRTRIAGRAAAQLCAALPAVGPPVALSGAVTTIAADTDTLVLVDTARLGRSYPGSAGTGSAANVFTALGSFTTTLRGAPAAQFGGTRAAVVDLATVPTVRSAYAAWDAQPCDPELANEVVAAIGRHLDTIVTPAIKNIVIIGADDQIPMARLKDNAPAHNEQEYAETWNEPSPVAASQSLGYMLSDDPYGTATPIGVGPRQLFVPDLAVGRLVETPNDIVRALDNFVTFNGRLSPQTALSTGYDFLEDGARAVGRELADRVVPAAAINTTLISTGLNAWTKADLVRDFAVAGPDIASVNAHFDHYRALPADQDAAGRLTDPVTLADVRNAANTIEGQRPLAASVIFSMGCHGGLSVSDITVGTLSSDWAQTFGAQGAAAFAGNTGYGYGDTEVVAFSEELMRLFAARLSQAPTIGAAMTAAKQRYISDLAVVSPFEEKVTSQVVFYGLPMYRITGTSAPVLDPFETVTPDPISGLGTSPQSIPLAGPAAATAVTTPSGVYYRIGEEVQATPYQPVQPRTSTDVTATGRIARGALITSLTSNDVGVIDPVVVTPADDVTGTNAEARTTGAVFPSVLQSISRVVDVGGARDRLVVVGGQFRGIPDDPQGLGVQRLFTDIGARVFYAPIGNTDTSPPVIVRTNATVSNGRAAIQVEVGVDDVARVLVLYVESDAPDPKVWRTLELGTSDGRTWVGSAAAASGATSVDYFVQVLDTGGNVSVASDKGSNFRAQAAVVVPPTVGDPTIELDPATPGASGWFTTPVTVTAVPPAGATGASLAINGSATTNPSTQSTTGVFTATATTAVGGNASRTFLVDVSQPTIAPSPAPGTLSSPQSIVLTGLDNGSGVASITWSTTGAKVTPSTTVTGSSVTVPLSESGTTTFTAVARDVAGNVSGTFTGVYTLPNLPPTATATIVQTPNGNGFHTSRPVTVRVAATPGSNPISTISFNGSTRPVSNDVATFDVTAEGTTVVTYVVTDTAGRTATGSVTVRIDTVPPVITCPAAPSYLLNQPNTAITATVEGGTVTSITQPAPTTTPGNRSVSFSASDSNGNSTTRTCGYAVRYRVQGFFEPINPTALNVANAGRNIPVKWRLTDFNNAPVATSSSFVSIAQTVLTSCGSLPPDLIEQYTAIATSTLQYNGDGNWQYNWKTEKSFRGCRALRVNLADGTSLTATFSFR